MALYGGDSTVCPSEKLAELVERFIFDRDVLHEAVEREYGKFRGAVTKAVLGCTHFVLVKDVFQSVLPGAELFDGNLGTAVNLKNRLAAADNLASRGQNGGTEIVTSCGDKEKAKLYRKVFDSCRG